MQRRNRRGFTLVEMLVALTLGAVVLMGARGLLDSLGAQASAVLRSAQAANSRANADDLLRRALADLIVGNDSLTSFDGGESGFTFRGSCDTPHGWREPCDVRVATERQNGELGILLWQGDSSSIELRRGLARASVRYLLTAEEGGHWTNDWRNTVMLPRAVSLIADDDTIIMRIGERR